MAEKSCRDVAAVGAGQGWRARVAERFFGGLIESRVQAAVQGVGDVWCERVGGVGPQDRGWWELRSELEDALEAWRTNPLAFRMVSLMTDYVVGRGIKIWSPIKHVDDFVRRFWEHGQNRMALRIYRWSDELAMWGELFICLFTNPLDGMSYVRRVPGIKINRVETDPEDLGKELRYHELRDDDPLMGRWWSGWDRAKDDLETPVVLHYAVNRPAGCVRGRGDLVPILPWVRRHQQWLEERVRVNRYKSAFLPRVRVEGAGVPVHLLSGRGTATRGTAREMTGRTVRHYGRRQLFFCEMLVDVVEKAAYRARVAGRMRRPRGGDLRLSYRVADLRDEDKLQAARGAREVAEYLVVLKERGWITDRKAMELAYKFAGEVVDVELLLEELEQEGRPRHGEVP